MIQHPALLAILPAHPVLQLEGLARLERSQILRDAVLALLRMDEHSGLRVAREHLVELGDMVVVMVREQDVGHRQPMLVDRVPAGDPAGAADRIATTARELAAAMARG